MTGGAGNDVFRLDGADATVTDFRDGSDRIGVDDDYATDMSGIAISVATIHGVAGVLVEAFSARLFLANADLADIGEADFIFVT